jgi:NAD dependent epimerase/dehydratase family enzyme
MLHGRQVVPNKLCAAGYAFRYPTIAEALRASL